MWLVAGMGDTALGQATIWSQRQFGFAHARGLGAAGVDQFVDIGRCRTATRH